MKKSFIQFLMNPKKWWIPLTLILLISITGVSIIGYETYHEAPPIPDFVDEQGQTVLTRSEVLEGQAVFQRKALMEYGSMFGDGANRGPDYTAEALHLVAEYMKAYYANQPDATKLSWLGAGVQVQREIKNNRYEMTTNLVRLGPAQVFAYEQLLLYYKDVFKGTDQNRSNLRATSMMTWN